jgi:CRISPR-associated protein Csm5
MINREELKIKLTVVSPVFIGGGESLNKSQYVLQEDQNQVGLIDEEKLADFIMRQGKWDDFVQAMGKAGFDLRRFLQSYQLSDAVAQLCRYTIPCPANTTKLNDINPFIKNHLYQPYIPGSSLKGALRTALAFALIKRDEFAEAKKSIWDKAVKRLQLMDADNQGITDESQKRDNRKRAWSEVGNIIGREIDMIFRKLAFKLDQNNEIGNDAVNDCLRGLVISDSRPLPPDALRLLQKNDAIIATDIVNNAIPTFRECLVPGSVTEMMITLDFDFLKYLGIQSWRDICAMLEFQKDFLLSWRNQAKQELAALPGGTLLALGGGVGFQAKSLFYAFAPDDNEARLMVSQWLDHAFRDHRHLELDTEVSPRTIKLAGWQDTWYDMGWVKLEEVKA